MRRAPLPVTSLLAGALALTAAILGWMFDGLEMGLFPLVGRPAMLEFTGSDEASGFWFSIIIAVFLVGAACGGVLLGWLGDRIGRVRAMSLSVLTYALFTGFCGLVKRPEQIAVLRFIAALGMGGEWALGVALVMEVWPNRSRALMAGLIGAAFLLAGSLALCRLRSFATPTDAIPYLVLFGLGMAAVTLPPVYLMRMPLAPGWPRVDSQVAW
mgnify:CR=1 FL=1